MEITKTVQIKVGVSKINDINRMPLSKAPDGSNLFTMKDRRNCIKFKTAKVNPRNKRVYFVTLFEEDLVNLVQYDGSPIDKEDVENNLFYVMKYQLI